MTFLTGCWNYREIDTLAIVSGLAIDKGENNYKYRVTFEVLDLSGGSDKPAQSKLIETEGDTVFDAVRNAVKSSEKKLFFSDCKAVIISNELAQEGLQPILDWFLRDAEPRINLNLLVSKDKKASDILKQDFSKGDIASYRIANMLEHDPTALGKNPKVTLYQANNMLNGKGTSLVLPTIETLTLESNKTLQLAGTAVFKEDKMIGYLDPDDSSSLLYVKGQKKGGLLLTKVDSDKSNISLEISDCKTKITPVIENDQISMKIDIMVKASMAEDNTGGNKLGKNSIADIQERAEQTLKANVLSVINKVIKKYDSDIFGFGAIVHQSNPKFWEQAEPKWDDILKIMKFDVTAKVKIENTATAKIKEKGSE
jgi:spore germination protein KC